MEGEGFTGSVIVAGAVDGHLILVDGSAMMRRLLWHSDQQALVVAIAFQLDIDHIRSELLPHDKVSGAERTNGILLMAGDGISDALAIAAGDIGISMGKATHRHPPSLPMQSCHLVTDTRTIE